MNTRNLSFMIVVLLVVNGLLTIGMGQHTVNNTSVTVGMVG